MLPVTSTLAAPSLAQPFGVGLGLRGDEGDALRRLLQQPAEAAGARQRTLRQPRIDQRHRHLVRIALRDQVGPHLGLHQDAQARREMPEEALHHPAGVVGQIDLVQPLAVLGVQLAAGGAAGRRHVREQQRAVGKHVQQFADQRLRGAGLADRHRMQPDQPAVDDRRRPVVKTQPLGDMLPVARFLAAAPPQAQQHQGQADPPQKRIKPAHQMRFRPVSRVNMARGLDAVSYWASAGR